MVHIVDMVDYSFTEVVVEAIPATAQECTTIGYPTGM